MELDAYIPDLSISQVNQLAASRWSDQQEKLSLTCMTMIDSATGWFKIIEVPCFDIIEVARGNN